MTTPENMPYRIALLIDSTVQQILYSNQEDAAKFLSQPTFHEIEEGLEVGVGFIFDGTNFNAPIPAPSENSEPSPE